MKTKRNLLIFFLGMLTVLFITPVLNFFNIPTYADILQMVFGDNKLLGTLCSLLLLGCLLFIFNKATKIKA